MADHDDHKKPAMKRQEGQREQRMREQLRDEESEATLLSNIEKRASGNSPHGDGFQPAVFGERAPLGEASLNVAFGTRNESAAAAMDFKTMAQRVLSSQRSAKLKRSTSTGNNGRHNNGHRRVATLLASIDESNRDMSELNKFGGSDSMDIGDWGDLINQDVHQHIDVERRQPLSSTSIDDGVQTPPHYSVSESLPLLSSTERYDGGSSAATARSRAAAIRAKKFWKNFRDCMNPIQWMRRIIYLFFHSFLVLALPCFAASWVLYYYMGNPKFDFMPGTATLSWWLNFFGRQMVVLELSRFTEYLVIDCITLSTRIVAKILGPLVTIFCIQSKGWPFVVAGWGVWDLLLLHGNNDFQSHWLYWSGIAIYSNANSGSYILEANVYLRILLAMVAAGVATTIKRTAVAIYFGKRNFEDYKPKLELILNDIILISEVADLAEEADLLPEDIEQETKKEMAQENRLKRRSNLNQVRWSSVRFQGKGSSLGDLGDEGDEPASPPSPSNGPQSQGAPERPMFGDRSRDRFSGLDKDSSGRLLIKNLLDRWDEPTNKSDRVSESTVHDVFKFRRALTYMDLQHPFSTSFGRASTRDECINSAEAVYNRLLKLSPGSRLLSFDVLQVLAENDDGTVDSDRRKHLKQLFRPDAYNELPRLAFIQSCDTVYKKLRYFRASVGNSSVIDRVLEGIINGVFYFLLLLMILSLVNLNPWPLLVSLSTLLVTFAFAVGPSISKAIEGILLIAGRRPYDIGDRIIISDSPGAAIIDNSLPNSWFVEDITLFSTTLRFGASNEVATISNGSIASSRITNCARSANAMVILILKLHIHLHDEQNLEKFKAALENYVADNPRLWELMAFFRCEEIDTDGEFVVYRLAVKSRLSWQVAPRVLESRADLRRFTVDLASKLKVQYDSAAPRRILYYGGALNEGAVTDYKNNLVRPVNINSGRGTSGDLGLFAQQAGSQRQEVSTSSTLDPTASAPTAFDTAGQNETDVQAQTQSSDMVSDMANDAFLTMVQQAQQNHG